MKIACLQFAPQVGDVDNNLNRADAVLNKANESDLDDLDLLVLPELAFTGYNFKSLHDISPFLEPSGSGISALWARTTALKYNCNVVLGYPEKVDVTPMWPTSPEYYNSCIVVNGDGETIANYRKSFLYPIDEKWALEGKEGFFDSYVSGLGNAALGISSDINPYKLESPWLSFEFAFHVLHARANLVIISMAWPTDEERRMYSRLSQEPDMDTVTYWVQRLEPIIRAEEEEETIVVFCNRTGTEDDLTYTGTSAVIGIKGGEVSVYGILGRGVKELLVVDTDMAPFAKLVQRAEMITPSGAAPSHNPSLLLPRRPPAPAPPEPLNRDGNPAASTRTAASTPKVRQRAGTPTGQGARSPASTYLPKSSRESVNSATPTVASSVKVDMEHKGQNRHRNISPKHPAALQNGTDDDAPEAASMAAIMDQSATPVARRTKTPASAESTSCSDQALASRRSSTSTPKVAPAEQPASPSSHLRRTPAARGLTLDTQSETLFGNKGQVCLRTEPQSARPGNFAATGSLDSIERASPPTRGGTASSLDSPMIATPTCPSPVPEDLRPKLAIPTKETKYQHTLTPYPTDDNTRPTPLIFDGTVTMTTSDLLTSPRTPATPYLDFYRDVSPGVAMPSWQPQMPPAAIPSQETLYRIPESPISRLWSSLSNASNSSAADAPATTKRNGAASSPAAKSPAASGNRSVDVGLQVSLPSPVDAASRKMAPLQSPVAQKQKHSPPIPERLKSLANRSAPNGVKADTPIFDKGYSPWRHWPPSSQIKTVREKPEQEKQAELHALSTGSTSPASITIAASPSVLRTSFPREHLIAHRLEHQEHQRASSDSFQRRHTEPLSAVRASETKRENVESEANRKTDSTPRINPQTPIPDCQAQSPHAESSDMLIASEKASQQRIARGEEGQKKDHEVQAVLQQQHRWEYRRTYADPWQSDVPGLPSEPQPEILSQSESAMTPVGQHQPTSHVLLQKQQQQQQQQHGQEYQPPRQPPDQHQPEHQVKQPEAHSEPQKQQQRQQQQVASISRSSSRRGHRSPQPPQDSFHPRSRSLNGAESGVRRVRLADLVKQTSLTGGNLIARPQTSHGYRGRLMDQFGIDSSLSPSALSDPTDKSTIAPHRERSAGKPASTKYGQHDSENERKITSSGKVRRHSKSKSSSTDGGPDEIIATISKITHNCPVHSNSARGTPDNGATSAGGALYTLTLAKGVQGLAEAIIPT